MWLLRDYYFQPRKQPISHSLLRVPLGRISFGLVTDVEPRRQEVPRANLRPSTCLCGEFLSCINNIEYLPEAASRGGTRPNSSEESSTSLPCFARFSNMVDAVLINDAHSSVEFL